MLRPRLLILTPRYPYPVIGGDRLRIYYLCKVLAQHFRLTLLSLCESESEMCAPTPDDGVFECIERVYLSRTRSRLSALVALPSRTPLQVAYYWSPEFHRRIEALAPAHDGLLAHLIRTGDAIRHLPQPKFLEMTDAISLNYARVSRESGAALDLRTQVYRVEAKRLEAYERAVVDDFDYSFLVSDIDRQFLFGRDAARLAKVMVCSNGVDLGGRPYRFEHAGRDVVFIGNMTTLQNLDMATFMATDVLPLVRARQPQSRLRVIGRIREGDAAALLRHNGVDVTGEVPNVAAAAQGGGVGVCPMRLGAGVQNKVLEYMALGLPTVTTALGLEGFAARDGHELMVANDASAFAAAVLMLLEDRDAAQAMAAAGRRYVEDHHSWTAMLQPMVDAVVERLCRTPLISLRSGQSPGDHGG
ncbi:glycosyltransferase involved in cell wall biosynthesis [Sphaerotilus hippei]|uniref:Glycosyltransferase involved in cell wall biosynthesis n=1 Tax=Sphaerotilus hippei TaxID=744406 RepID=A0A318H1Z5_9BURK|nr:glycosyltransferase [Sphaerotilus hippei]PXW97068.1 glycosyltransferase involved in cell wall biosynthesis [Sphaerotilus hippei]